MSLILPLELKWPHVKDQHGFPVFVAAAINEDQLNSVVIAVNNHERLIAMLREAVSMSRANKMGWIQKAAALLATLEAEKRK